MKKIMIALTAGILAVTASAATFTWNVADINTTDGSGLASGYRAWAFLAATSKEGITTISVDDAIALIAAGDIATLKTYQLKTGKTTDGTWKSSAYDGGWDRGDTLSAYSIVFDVGDATPTSASKYIVSNIDTITFANATTARNGSLSMSAATWQTISGAEPVPEPTSGLLMLLGMAGLALRRKRA